jgi:hypothetical protein
MSPYAMKKYSLWFHDQKIKKVTCWHDMLINVILFWDLIIHIRILRLKNIYCNMWLSKTIIKNSIKMFWSTNLFLPNPYNSHVSQVLYWIWVVKNPMIPCVHEQHGGIKSSWLVYLFGPWIPRVFPQCDHHMLIWHL